MGRAEDRKRARECKKKLSEGQFKTLMNQASSDYVKIEVNRQMNFLQKHFTDAIIESLKKNGMSNTKISIIIDDIQAIFFRKVKGIE